MTEKYFNQTPLLTAQKYHVEVKHLQTHDLNEVLPTNTAKYTVVAHNLNEIKFGYYANKQFTFADNSELNTKYLLNLRLFNANEEILIQKISTNYQVRIIKDQQTDDSQNYSEAVDNTSRFFGSSDQKIDNHFVHISEPGRKMEFTLPSDQKAKYYDLTTRSYITYDKQTGQAGYAYYRYVSIQPENKGGNV